MSEAMKNHTVEKTSVGPRLWNPTAAANWSLLFTFVFGAWVHAKNWRALNEPKRAKESMIWVWIGIVLLVASLAGSVAFAQPTGGLMFLDVQLPEEGFRSDRPFELTVQGHTIRMQASGSMELGRKRINAQCSLHTSIPGQSQVPDDTQSYSLSGPYAIRDNVLIVGEGEDQTRHAIDAEGSRMGMEVDDGIAVWQRIWRDRPKASKD